MPIVRLRARESGWRREPHGGWGSGRRMEILARLREQLDRGDGRRRVDGDDPGERKLALWQRGYRRRTASRPGAGTAVVRPLAVGRCGGVLRSRMIVVCRCTSARFRRRLRLTRRTSHHSVRSAVARAPHHPLRLAHEERHPERECDVENPTPQGAVHAVSYLSCDCPERPDGSRPHNIRRTRAHGATSLHHYNNLTPSTP
jgi:hypothetical protein